MLGVLLDQCKERFIDTGKEEYAMMNDMKIAFFETEEWEKAYLEQQLAGHELRFFPEPLEEKHLPQIADVESLSVFIYSAVTKDVIRQLPQLRLVTTRSTGYDHVDTAYAKEKGIIVCNVPHYGTYTVAEHAFSLILALSRKIFQSIRRTRDGEFDHHELTGFDLYGKTLGIVGLGDIGSHVLKIAKGFGMHVVAYAHHPDEKLARRLGITFLNLNELYAASDIVTLHLPYMKATHHMINKRAIRKFKKGSLLINTARGGLVDTEALLYGLEKGILAGAGLDVLEHEDIIAEERQILSQPFAKNANFKTLYFDHILMDRDNVVVTPHNAFNSIEALHKILDVTIQNTLDFQKKNPHNMV